MDHVVTHVWVLYEDGWLVGSPPVIYASPEAAQRELPRKSWRQVTEDRWEARNSLELVRVEVTE